MTVSPKHGPVGTVFRFRGRGWRPGRTVTAWRSPYCEGACEDQAFPSRIRTNRRGGWVFKLRHGPREPGDRKAGIVPGELSYFEQWTGKPYESRLIRRKAPYRVD